ncbi:MAG: NTP transferase domain-containing protein [Thermodesulforhabdaceae bacterium]
MEVASLILAAGRGTRMTGYGGCKALLPLIPSEQSQRPVPTIYEGTHPFILEILNQLPLGPKAIVIHHDADRIQKVVKSNLPENLQPVFIWQPELNGTGGAVLAGKPFLQSVSSELCLITMGDVPLISRNTYCLLLEKTIDTGSAGTVLAFRPANKGQYGCLITEGDSVKAIIEWKYWKELETKGEPVSELCNAGVYAFRRNLLLECLSHLSAKPHLVQKNIDGRPVTFEEFFLTDVVEILNQNGFMISFVEAGEEEVLGVDTPEQLQRAQEIYRQNLTALSYIGNTKRL